MEIANMIMIITITGALGALIAFATTMYFYKRGPVDSTEQRIQSLSSSLIEAMKLIGEMEKEVNSKHSLLEKLRKDIETYSQIVSLKEPEVEAVTQLLRRELQLEGKRSFWRTVGVSFAFFAIGAIVSGLLVALL